MKPFDVAGADGTRDPEAARAAASGSGDAAAGEAADYIPVKSGFFPLRKEPMPSLAAAVQATRPKAR